ncbi:MAG: ECF transporter S component [Lachnospiraceae bacterium]|nr:ECF transporter S component [Lachnospiraceae bacterium]MBR1523022.1 ECF transporter S component [Lachnospiraceae bacterium]
MKGLKNTRVLVMAALLAAMTYVATTVIKIPTPTMGYVHIGDSFVLLSGFLLGSLTGGLAAGIGSMLSDLLGGYVAWAPGTFIIKFATAAVGALVFERLGKKTGLHLPARSIISGVSGELVMIVGYFLYNIIMLTLVNTGAEQVALGAAIVQSFAEIPFNGAQGIIGICLSTALIPVLEKIPVKSYA